MNRYFDAAFYEPLLRQVQALAPGAKPAVLCYWETTENGALTARFGAAPGSAFELEGSVLLAELNAVLTAARPAWLRHTPLPQLPIAGPYLLLPLPLLSGPAAALLLELPASELPTVATRLEQLPWEPWVDTGLLVLTQRLMNGLPAALPLGRERCLRLLARLLLAVRFRWNEGPWEVCCPSLPPGPRQTFRLGAQGLAEIELAACAWPGQPGRKLHELPDWERRADWLRAFVEALFGAPGQSAPGSAEALLQETRQLQTRILDDVGRLNITLQRLQPAGAEVPAAAAFEFFRNSTGWHIRFEGRLVPTRGNHKGLKYIHTLLLNPEKKFYPNELEPLVPTELSDKSLLFAGDGLVVETGSVFQRRSAGNETGLRQAMLEFQQAEKPDPDDRLEDQIYYLSQMLYFLESLKNIRSTREYIRLYQEYRDQLDVLTHEFRQQFGDGVHVTRVLQHSRAIRAVEKSFHQDIRDKLRDRVVKNIDNAIKGMDDEAARLYLQNCIKRGMQSYYSPDANRAPDWVLEIG